MNMCVVCNKLTNNNFYCSMKCRDINRHKNRKHTEVTRFCKTCGNKFICLSNSYKEYCSNKCSTNNPERIEKMIKKMKETKLEKYGDENYVNIEKMKKTNLKKYGVESFFQTIEFKEKSKKTNNKKYGVDYPQQNEEIKNKSKETVMKNYNGYTFQSDILSSKVKKTLLNRYGVDNPNKSIIIQEKIKKTNLDRYGFEYGLQNPDIIKKRKNTVEKKYGVVNVSMVPDIKEKVKITHKKNIYNNLFNSNRLKNMVIPLFNMDEYDGNEYFKKYLFQCNVCKNEFTDRLYSGNIPRCPNCYPIKQNSSVAETELKKMIRKYYSGKIIENSKKILSSGKELDLYFPDKQLAIEFNGIYWHSELGGNKSKYYHLEKTKECEKQNIHLIHIWEDDWVHKNDIIEHRLKNIFSVNEKIYARICEIKEILPSEKNEFLFKYHLQGEDKSYFKVGLFYKSELISVMTFSKLRIALGQKPIDETYELSRFSSKYNVIGGASKLLSYFIKKYNPKKIISYADRCWTTLDNMYEKLNFNKMSDGYPNYWYIKNGIKIHRFNFRKSVLNKKLEKFDSNLTEWQNMQLNGYDRIWDCGNFKYIWENKSFFKKN